jgi:hypothetical protein
MNEKFVFNLNSIVVDDLASASAFGKIGLTKVWEGVHPFFRTKAAAYATRKGGIMVFQVSPDAHPAISRYAGRKERYFHIELLVPDLEVQKAVAERSSHHGEISDIYQGPFGRSFAVQLKVAGGSDIWLEFTEGHKNLIGSVESAFICVDSTAMVAPDRDVLLAPLKSLGLVTDPRADNGDFGVLAAINAVMMLQDWHYLEVNEPTQDDGVMNGLLQRIGHPGIFGTNLVPVDMDAFVRRAKEQGVGTNTEDPILLNVSVGDTTYKCADIVTINPRSTGGARVFVLTPLEYPWQLVA